MPQGYEKRGMEDLVFSRNMQTQEWSNGIEKSYQAFCVPWLQALSTDLTTDLSEAKLLRLQQFAEAAL